MRSLLDGRSKQNFGGEGTAALIWAIQRNDAEMVDLLLNAGVVDVRAANEFGATALYAAASNPDAAMTAKLLAAGADPNACLLSGETPLMEAARRGNLDSVHQLLTAGANPNAQEANGGQTALMWAISERQSAVTEELVRRGADINVSSKRGFTALMFAAQQGDVDSARVLLGAGGRVNDAMPRTGLTPLIIASAMRYPKVVDLLLDNDADPNVVDANGFTSLHHAARDRAALGIVKALLAHGARPNVRLKQQKPTVTVNGVILQGATPLALAANLNNLEAVIALVEAGADPLIPTELNMTPMMLAAGAGTDVVRPRPSRERTTALQTVRFLIARGADVNGIGQFGWTPLHAAAYQGLNDVIEFLVSKGAQVDAKDDFGQTPLSIANAILTRDIGAAAPQIPRIYRRETAELLLRLGATALDKSGVVVVLQRTGE
jgi:cytohesin